jgi:signal peptidase I
MPTVAYAACIIAFLTAAGIAVSAFLGPIVLLLAAVVPLCSAIGILRRHAWAAWGFAVCRLAELLLLVPLIFWRTPQAKNLESLQTIVGAVILGPAMAVLFYFAGRSLAATGAPRGRAWPWLIAAAIFTVPLFFFQAFVVPTGSMEDTLLVGDRIFVERFPRAAPHRGEVMALVYPVDRKQTFLKRIVGMPGDRIRMIHKVLYVNGAAAVEPWVVHKMDYEDSYRDDFPSEPNTPLFPPATAMLANNVVNGELIVPKGKYFVMGDNRDQSLDSRYWGFVSDGDFLGRPVMIYDSVEQSSQDALGAGLLKRGHTRWNRLFKLL